MRAWSPLYFDHVMTSYDNLLQIMTHIHYCHIDQLSGPGNARFTGLKRHPGQCQFDFYLQSIVQRHHKYRKWKDT